jgi:hypothetical protein
LAVDLVQSTGEDAYYVMGFIPNTGDNDPTTLAGYGFAKDPTDILITKGIEKYFVADAGITAELKNDNVRLVLNLLVKNGTVWINARALDLDDNQAVLWERTVADTPGADVLDDGTDSPAAPYITSGYFTIFCYVQDPVGGLPYAVTYDNAVVLAPPAAANVAPSISDVQPAAYGNFLPAASTQVRFTASDDKTLATDKVAVTLNGIRTTTANGLVVGGAGSSLTVSLGNLQPDQNYVALLEVEDSEGLQTTRNLYFDTFLPGHRVIEIEDYNHSGGTFIDNPVPTSEGFFDDNSYSMLAGIAETDFHDTQATPNGADTMYRPDDPVRMQRSLDIVRQKYTDAGGAASLVYDYDVGDIATGEWLHYTRNFASGTYEVYLRQALANIAAAESVLERVTGDRTQPDATTQPLGSFLGSLTGFQYRNFPLTDGTGVNRVILRLSGVTTLRLRQVTPDPDDGGRYENYMVFVPVPDPGVQRATVASVAPANGATETSVMPRIQASLLNRDTAVNTNTVVLEINGQPVSATVTPTADGATVDHALSPLPASGSSVDVRLSFRDSEDELISTVWSFVLAYTSLDPATRVAGAGLTRGFNVRVVQAAQGGTALENSLQRAETQLAPNSSIAKEFDTNIVATLINYSQEPIGSADGSFPDDTRIPGLDEFGFWTDDIAMEVTTYLELAPGAYRFGNHCDDGYKVQSVAVFTDVNAAPLAFHNGGPANETYDFVVTVGGLYPFRLVWYERGGGAHVEWFSANFVSGQRTMLNDTGSPATAWSAIEALAEFNPPTLSNGQMGLSWTGDGILEEAPAVTGPWAPSANQTNPQSVSVPGSGSKFYRVNQSP